MPPASHRHPSEAGAVAKIAPRECPPRRGRAPRLRPSICKPDRSPRATGEEGPPANRLKSYPAWEGKGGVWARGEVVTFVDVVPPLPRD